MCGLRLICKNPPKSPISTSSMHRFQVGGLLYLTPHKYPPKSPFQECTAPQKLDSAFRLTQGTEFGTVPDSVPLVFP